MMNHLIWIGAFTAVIEGVTCLFRFGLSMQSTRDTAFLRHLTFGFRIHHGYIGLAAVILVLLIAVPDPWRKWILRIGWAMVASDLLHHFLVLWPITGDPQFHLRYPDE